jgi:hypothetical protein
MFNFLNRLFKSIKLNPSKPFPSRDVKTRMVMKKVGIYGAAGFAVAVLIIAGIITSGLKLPGFYNRGTLIVKLTDEPVELEHLNVTITDLAVHKAVPNGGEGEWMTLPFVEDKTSFYVDILSLQNVSRDMSVAELLPGNYTTIRLTISTANATYSDGTVVNPLLVPPGHIDVIVHFEIKAGETTTLLVDMTGHISETDSLAPVLKAIVV